MGIPNTRFTGESPSLTGAGGPGSPMDRGQFPCLGGGSGVLDAFLKKRGRNGEKKEEIKERLEKISPVFYDFLAASEGGLSSSGSSGVTNASHMADEEEESSKLRIL